MKQLTSRPQCTRDKRVATLLTIAQLGYAHWFFGNLYEAVVRVPDRLAKVTEPGVDDRRPASVLSPGSPVWYYVPGIPVVIAATLAALVAGWTSRNDRPWLGAAALFTLLGVVATAYLVRAVNVKLFVAGQPLTQADRDRLLRVWYRVNVLRLLTAGSAWLIAAHITSRLRSRRT
jgi:hypothetical protein